MCTTTKHYDRMNGVKISLWYVVGITLFAIGLYWRDLDGNWILDDKGTITMNPVVKGETDWMEVWNRDFWGRDQLEDAKSHKSWRPLCTATYRWNYIWSEKIANKDTESSNNKQKGKNPEDISSYWFHVVDRILHGLVTGLSYMVSSYCWIPHENISSVESVFKDYGPMLVALFFAAHPIHVESVANSTGRAEVLCALFYFLGFCIYAQSTRRSDNRAVFIPFFGVMTCTFSSMLCKEHGITLPIMCIIWDAYIHTQTSISELFQSLSSNRRNNTNDENKNLNDRCCFYFWMRAISFALGVIALAIWRLKKNGTSEPDFVCEQNPAACETVLWTRFIHYSYLWCFNFYLLLFPERLSPDWSGDSIPLFKSPYVTDPRFPACILLWYALFVFLHHAISTSLFYKHNNQQKNKDLIIWRRSITTSMCWMLLPFLMSSNLLVYVGFVVADRTLYLPSFGYCMLLVQTLDAFYIPCYNYFFGDYPEQNQDKFKSKNLPKNSSTSKKESLALTITISTIMVLYIWKQQVQTRNWSDPVLIWGEGYRVNPNSCINGSEYASSLVNAQRAKDAADIFLLNYKRESHGNWFRSHISDARNFQYDLSEVEKKINDWSRTAKFLQSMFKLVTAMGNSGRCIEARSYIEEGLTLANSILESIEIEKKQPGADLVGIESTSRTHSLQYIYQVIVSNKALLLVAKSRCAETAAIMGKAAYDAVMILPGDKYVADHAITVNKMMGVITSQKINPNEVILGWQLRDDGQTAEMTLQTGQLQMRA